MQAQFRHLSLKSFAMVFGTLQFNEFLPLQLPSKGLGVHRDSNSQSERPFGSVWVHSLTLSYTLGGMKCDSWVSLLAHTFASPCGSHKPKARVATFQPPSNANIKLFLLPFGFCWCKWRLNHGGWCCYAFESSNCSNKKGRAWRNIAWCECLPTVMRRKIV